MVAHRGDYERKAVEAMVGRCEDGVNWALIRLAQSSVANLSVVPLQDVLGLGSEARLNTPQHAGWQLSLALSARSVDIQLADRLARLAEVTDRLPQVVSYSTRGFCSLVAGLLPRGICLHS